MEGPTGRSSWSDLRPGARLRGAFARSWIRRTALFVGFVLAVPFVATYVLVRTEWGRDRLRDAVVETIHAELGLNATLRDLEVGVFPPRVVAGGIALDDPEHGRVVEADVLVIRPSLSALLIGSIDLQVVEIERPVLNLIVRDGRIVNVPEFESSGDGPVELPFSRLLITRAELRLDAEPYGTAVLQSVEIVVDRAGGTDFSVEVSSPSGELTHARGSELVQRLSGTALVTGDGVDVGAFSFWTPYLKVDLNDTTIPIPFDNTYAGAGRVRVNLRHLETLPFSELLSENIELPPLVGVLEFNGAVRGEAAGPSAEGTLVLENGEVDGRGLGNAVLPVVVNTERARITGGVIEVIEDGGSLHLSGTIGLSDGFPVDLYTEIDHLQLAKLLKQLGTTPNAIAQWTLTGPVRLEGTLDPFDFGGGLQLQTEDFFVSRDAWHERPVHRIMGVERGSIRGQISFKDDGVRFRNLVADTGRSHLTGDLLLGFDNTFRLNVGGQVDLLDVTPLLDFPLAGNGTANVEVTGTFQDPIVGGRMAVRGFEFDTFPLGDVEGPWRLEKGGVAIRFPTLTATKNESEYRVENLFFDFDNDRFSIDADVIPSRVNLSDFFHIFHYENDERFDGYLASLGGRATIRYTLGFPGDSPTGTMVTDFDLDLRRASIDGIAFDRGEIRGRWRWLHYEQGYRGGELLVHHAHLTKGQGVLSANGRMALQGVLQMSATADRFAVTDTEGLSDVDGLGGLYSLVADIGGTAETPRVSMDVNLTGLSYGANMLGDGQLYVRLTDREDPWIREAANWDPGNLPRSEPCVAARNGLFRGRWPADPPLRTIEGPLPRLARPMGFAVCGEALGGKLAVDMAIGRTLVYPLRGRLSVDQLDLSPILAQAFGGLVGGEISGEVEFDAGALRANNTLGGRARITSLRLGPPGVEISNNGPMDLRVERGGVRVNRAVLTGPSSDLEVTGTASQQRGLALAVNGDVDLALVSTLSPMFSRVDGNLSLHVNVSGPLNAPAVYGQAEVQNAGLRFAEFPEPVQDLSGMITFSSRRVLFENFTAQVAGGELNMSGFAALRGTELERYEFDIDATRLRFSPEDDVSVAFGGRTQLSWQSEQRLPVLSGTIRLGRVEYARTIEISPTISSLTRRQRTEVEQYDPADDGVQLDLRVIASEPIRVQNDLMEAEIEIEDSERPFRIVGTDQRAGVLGSLSIPRGTVRFRNAEFDVREGTIDFDDEHRIDPSFDVTATTTIRRAGDVSAPRWQINLHAHGTRDSVELDMSSEPDLSEEDIALLLTVGMTRAEAQQLQAGDFTGAALEALTTVTGIDREVERALPVIDDFQVTSRYSPRTNRTEPHLSIGKRIAERVRLTASTGLGEEREVRAGLQWQIGDETSLELSYDNINTTSTSTFGNLGVDLHWRLEFE